MKPLNLNELKIITPKIQAPDYWCSGLGLIDSQLPNTLGYLADERFAEQANNNKNLTALIIKKELSGIINREMILVINEDPVWLFWTLHNERTKRNSKEQKTSVDPTVVIKRGAVVSENNVTIGKNTIIEENVVIYPDVNIGSNVLIRSGSCIGFDGFEHKMTSKGILSVKHDGSVEIADNVEIGPLNSIAKGFSWKNTIIEYGVKTDSLVHIAHSARIGKNCMITACAEISGSVIIGENCWLGPNCSVINGITVGDNVFIGIGAVVTKDVRGSVVLAGNPAKVLRDAN